MVQGHWEVVKCYRVGIVLSALVCTRSLDRGSSLGGSESHRAEAEVSCMGWRARAFVQGHWEVVKGYWVGIVLKARVRRKSLDRQKFPRSNSESPC